MSLSLVADPEELSDELPLIPEDTDRSESFLMSESLPRKHQGDIAEEEGDVDDTIQSYIDGVYQERR